MAMDAAQQSPSGLPRRSSATKVDAKAGRSITEWILERNRRLLVCSVTQLAQADSYEVAMQPLWETASAVAERFRDPLTALQRHAAIARGLRDQGWVVAAFTPAFGHVRQQSS